MEANQVVAEVADEAAEKGDLGRRRGVSVDHRAQPREGIGELDLGLAAAIDLESVREDPVDLTRPAAEETVARDLLAAGDALEEEAWRVRGQAGGTPPPGSDCRRETHGPAA